MILRTSHREGAGGILLLDEAKSNIDRETDEVMQRIIREVLRGYTILVVAHILDWIVLLLLICLLVIVFVCFTSLLFHSIAFLQRERLVLTRESRSQIEVNGDIFREPLRTPPSSRSI